MSTTTVRFAPSPTGYLHIGGARTAVFNWLLARATGGRFLLRIEDTDHQRSKPEYEREIIEAMSWLGMTTDEEPVRQSERETRHREVVEQLLESGAAFRCFVDPEKATAMKKRRMEEDGRAFHSPDRDQSAEQQRQRAEAGEAYVVRFRIPEGETTFHDEVFGDQKVPGHSVDDFIIARSDGSPTYNLAVVVDDHDMEVSHVVRGDDHKTNSTKQALLYDALGWQRPLFAHVPLILGADKKRLSKRHGATAVTEYREQGYLPEAVLSYLAMLGWNPGGDRENLSREELIEVFSLDGINKSPAVFDEAKLEAVNIHFLGRLPTDEWVGLIQDEAQRRIDAGELPAEAMEKLPLAVELLRDRAHFPREVLDRGAWLFADPVTISDAKAARKRLKDEQAPELLDELARRYQQAAPSSEEAYEEILRTYAEELEASPGKLIHPTRLAVSGMGAGPSLFAMLVALGVDTVVRRLHWLADFLREKGTPPELDES